MWTIVTDASPLPTTPGISIPPWTPFAVGAAAVVLVPAMIAQRWSGPRRIAFQQWSGLVPIAGLLLMSWVALDTFALQLSWEDGCLPPVGPLCYRANRGLLVLGIAWGILAGGLLTLLLWRIRTQKSPLSRRDIAPFVALLCVVSASVGIGTLPYLGYYQHEPLASTVGWSAFTTAFVAFAAAAIWADKLVGRWAGLARWLALAEGVALMAFAFVAAYEALGPPPVFA